MLTSLLRVKEHIAENTKTIYRAALSLLVTHYAALLIIVFGLLIRLPLVFMPLTYSLTDTWRQTDTASIAHNFLDPGSSIFYPRINWGGSGPGYVEAEFQLYTFITALLYRLLGEQVALGRFVSLLFTLATLIVFYRLARRLFSPLVARAALFAFVILPLSLRYSTAFMPEATVLFFYVTALYLFQIWLDEQDFRVLLLAGISTALALLVKPTSINIGLIFGLLLVTRYRLRFALQPRLWLFAAISLVPAVLWYLHARNLFLTYRNTFGILSGGDSKFGSLSYWLSFDFYTSLSRIEIQWVLDGAGVLLFAIGFALAVRRRHPLLFIFGVLIMPIYYLIVARYAGSEWGAQYHIYAVPFAALGIGAGLGGLWQAIPGGLSARRLLRSGCFWAAALAAALMLVWSAHVLFTQLLVPVNENLRQCGIRVSHLVPEDARIIVSTTSVAVEDGVPNNYQEPDIFFYSHRYGWSLPADWHTPEMLDEYRLAGARYFIIYSSSLYSENPALAAYLTANAEQVGPGVENGCGIFRFTESG